MATSYAPCAEEKSNCNFTGKKSVAYQAIDKSGSVHFRNPENGVMCDTDMFGDPAPGQPKQCLLLDIPSNISYADGLPVNFKQCADQDGECYPKKDDDTPVEMPVDILYGADGKYVYAKTVSTPCNNTIFGDPEPGKVKRCYWRNPEEGFWKKNVWIILIVVVIIVAVIIFIIFYNLSGSKHEGTGKMGNPRNTGVFDPIDE